MSTQLTQILQCLQPVPGLSELGLSHKLLCVALLGSDKNDYEIRKHRQALTEGVDWVSAAVGVNNTARILYSLSGIRKLCALLAQTQYGGRAQHFMQELNQVVPPMHHPHPQAGVMPQLPPVGSYAPAGYPVHVPQPPQYTQPEPNLYADPNPAILAMRQHVTTPIVSALQQIEDPIATQERLTELQIRSLEAHTTAFCRVIQEVRGVPPQPPPPLPVTAQPALPEKPVFNVTSDPFKLGFAAILLVLVIAGFGWNVVQAARPPVYRNYSGYTQ